MIQERIELELLAFGLLIRALRLSYQTLKIEQRIRQLEKNRK